MSNGLTKTQTNIPVSSVDKMKLIWSILGVSLGVIVFCLAPPAGLTPQAMQALGIFVWAVVYWIFEVIPDYITATLMCTLWVAFKVVPFTTAFASFAGDTVWLLIPALAMGVAVNKSGLLKRVALVIMSFFPGTFKGQTLALLSAGMIITPLIPSATAKVAIVAPFAKSISETMGYEKKSCGAGGIFASMFIGVGVLYPLFLSASYLCYLIRGALPKAVQEQFTWTTWLMSIFPWGLIVLIGSYFALQLLYKPKNEKVLPPDFIKQQIIDLGPMAKKEKITMVILIVSLLLWMTERVHGISAALVALFAFCALVGFKVFDRQDFRSEMPWDIIVFIGGIINLASVIPYLKIDTWIATLVGPYIALLMSNMYVFVIVAATGLYLMRFILVSQTATVTILVVMIIPFAAQAGVNPWVPAIITMVSVNIWNAIYQNTTFLAAFYSAGEMVSFKQMVPLSITYMGLSLVGLLVCVPLWKVLGLIP